MTKRLLPLAVLAALILPAAAGGSASPPETTITSGPIEVTNATSATFAFSSDDPAARFACALDSAAFSNCASPFTVSAEEGTHHFYVVAVDGAATDPTPAVRTWTVDTHPPAPVTPHASVTYGRLVLSWKAPASLGASSIALYRSGSAKALASIEIYRGSGTAYVDTSFKNGFYHRYRTVAVDAAGNASAPREVVVGADALLSSPKADARLKAPVRLRWRPAAGATYYNAQLFHRGQKVLSAWPRTARMTVSKAWRFKGKDRRLAPGGYTWYVWPGFGPLVQGHYGQLLGQSSFAVR
jgi:hypothetical protein